MTTNFKTYNPNTSNYQDLSNVFLPLSSGVATTATNFVVNGQDLNKIFASINSPGAVNIGFDTGYKISDGTDLRNVFASINSLVLFLTTSELLTTPSWTNKSNTTLATNFYLSSGYNHFNFKLYGGGGDGAQAGTSTYGTGGAGAGSFISAINIPYSSSGIIISSITYQISGGGTTGQSFLTKVTITYSDNTKIILNAGSGQSTNISSGTAGAAGGTASYTNNTVFYSNTNITTVDGTSGGNQGSNGTTNGYTSSGSGNSGGSTAPVGNPPTATKIYSAPDGNTYTIYSAGGGKTQESTGSLYSSVTGYSSAGAATPANYLSNAPAYRYGSHGCIVFYLSS